MSFDPGADPPADAKRTPPPFPGYSDWEWLGPLGSGSFGCVYLGRSRGPQDDGRMPDGTPAVRIVNRAFKVIYPTDSRDLNAAWNEYARVRGLESPYLARQIALAAQANYVVITMEYFESGSLLDWLSRELTLSPYSAASVAADMCEGLVVLHEARLLHHDVKPANTLLRPSAGPARFTASLTDFGLTARVTYAGDSPEHRLGTWNFLPPERLAGEAGAERSDVWAVGQVLHVCLTGHPFCGSTQAALRADHVPDRLDLLKGLGYPTPLWQLMTRMLSPEPGDRPSAAEAATQLRALLACLEDAPRVPKLAVPPAPVRVTDSRAYRESVLRLAGQDDPFDDDDDGPRPPRPARRLVLTLMVAGVLVAGGVGAAASVGGGGATRGKVAAGLPTAPTVSLSPSPTLSPTPTVVTSPSSATATAVPTPAVSPSDTAASPSPVPTTAPPTPPRPTPRPTARTVTYLTLCQSGQGGHSCGPQTWELQKTPQAFTVDESIDVGVYPEFRTIEELTPTTCSSLTLRFAGFNATGEAQPDNLAYLRVTQTTARRVESHVDVGDIGQVTVPLDGKGAVYIDVATTDGDEDSVNTGTGDVVGVTGTASCTTDTGN